MRHSQLRFYLPTSDIRFSASAVAPAGVSDCQSECYMYVALSSRVSKESRLTDDPATLKAHKMDIFSPSRSLGAGHCCSEAERTTEPCSSATMRTTEKVRQEKKLDPLPNINPRSGVLPSDLASEGALDHGDSVGGDSGALGVEERLAAVALQLGEPGHAGAVGGAWRHGASACRVFQPAE